MPLKMTATIYANSELGLADALTEMSRLVKRGCMYDNQNEDGVAYSFLVTETPPLVLDLEGGFVRDPRKGKMT